MTMTNEQFEKALTDMLGGAKKRNDERTYQYAASILEQYRNTFGDERRRFRRKCERLFVKHLRPATPTTAK